MNTNRRLFLKYGAAAGAGVFASGLHPWSRMAYAADLAAQELRTTGLSVTVQDRILEMFRAASGVSKTVGTPATFPDAQTKILSGSSDYDCWEIIAERLPALIATNNVDPIPAKDLPNWAGIRDTFTKVDPKWDPKAQISGQIWTDEGQTQLYMVPAVFNYDSIGYNPDVLSDEEANTWTALFDDKWKGRSGLNVDPLIAIGQAVFGDNLKDLLLAEPVQGEAGVRPPRPGYLDALRRRCDEVGALLIFDEIQTGMGRTGELFAMLKYGVTPDIVCLAKAFGGGMPLGAFVARHEVMDTLQENPTLGHITTFGGHPVCCAAGLAALNYLVDNKVVERVETKGALYEMLLKDHPAVREIRRSGLLLAVELGESAKLYRIMELFREAGILSDWFLFCDTAFRISPPLTISEDEVRESAALIRSCLDRL